MKAWEKQGKEEGQGRRRPASRNAAMVNRLLSTARTRGPYSSCWTREGYFASRDSPYNRAMNKMLEKAVAAIKKLPDAQQEAIAANILDDLEAERGWDERFARSQDNLARLSKRASERIAENKTLPFDPSDRPKQ